MIKILFFIPKLSEGGAEKVLCNLVNNMDLNKFDITVQTVDCCDAKKYLVNGVKYKSIFGKKSLLPAKLRNLWYRICTEFKWIYPLYIKDDYDVEIAYLECGATKVIASSTNKKAKKYAWVHCDMSKREEIVNSSKKTKKYYQAYDQIVCVSENVREGFCEVFGNAFTTCVIPNVVDEEQIFNKMNEEIDLSNNTSEKQLLAVGRLAPEKNYSYLIDSCMYLKNRGIKFHLTFLGEGPEREKLEKQIRDLKLQNEITLKGFVKNPYPWIKKADLVVCSSLYEGMSTVVQEALILGTPVVTTLCAGMKDLLGDSEYGLIVQNNKEGLGEGLYSVLKDDELFLNYVRKANERGKTLQKRNTVKKNEELFTVN